MSTNAQISVLIVDDQVDDAQSFKTLVESQTSLVTYATSDPGEALAVVQENAVTVLVIDQRMPQIEGTKLYENLKKFAPHAKAIMFTQGDDAGVVANAFNEHDYAKHLHKSKVAELPGLVLSLHARSLADRSRAVYEDEDIYTVRRWGLRDHDVRVFSRELNSRYVDNKEWRSLVDINAGEEKRVSLEESSRRSFSIEQKSELELSKELGLEPKQLAGLKARLEAKYKRTLRMAEDIEVSSATTLERTLKLPEEPATRDERYVRSRHFEFAPVYRRYQMTLRSVCRHCGQEKFSTAVIRQGTGLVALRQTDYWSDDEVRHHLTGFRSI